MKIEHSNTDNEPLILQTDGRLKTVEAYLDEIGIGRLQYWLLFLCGIGYTTGTIELVLSSLLLPALAKDWGKSSLEMGYISTASFSGQLIGSIISGFLSDFKGRRFVFSFAPLLIFFTGSFCALAPDLEWMIFLRFLLGVALGGSLGIDFVMFVEFTGQKYHRSFPSILIFFGIMGVASTALIGNLTLVSSNNWRFFLLICAFPNLILFVLRLAWKLESPQFLTSRNRTVEAYSVLHDIARANGSNVSIGQITNSYVSTNTNDNSLFLKNSYKIILFHVIWFIVTFGYYGWTLWLSYFLHEKQISISIYMNLFLISVSEIPGLLLATVLSIFMGHSKALAIVLVGCASSTLYFGIVTSEIAVILTCCSLYFWIVGAWSIIYVFTPESFPASIRSRAYSFASMGATIAGMIVGPLCGWLIDSNLNHFYILVIFAFMFFSGSCLAMFLWFTDRHAVETEPILNG